MGKKMQFASLSVAAVMLVISGVLLVYPQSVGAQQEPANCKGATAKRLLIAARNNDIPTVSRLIDCGVDPSAEALWRQVVAPKYGEVMTLRATPLHAAAWNGHLQVIRILINAGADLDAFDEWNFTPLMIAAETGKTKVIRLLLSAGADANLKSRCANCRNDTALTIASEFGHAEAVRLLLENGADRQHKRKEGLSARNLAVLNGHKNVVTVFRRIK